MQFRFFNDDQIALRARLKEVAIDHDLDVKKPLLTNIVVTLNSRNLLMGGVWVVVLNVPVTIAMHPLCLAFSRS